MSMQDIGSIRYVTDTLIGASPYRDEPFLLRGGRPVVFEDSPHADGIDRAFQKIADYSESNTDQLVFSGFIPIEKADSEQALRGVEAFCTKGIRIGSHVKGGSRLFRLWADYLLRTYDAHCKAKSTDYCNIFGFDIKEPLHLSNVELSIARVYLFHGDHESLEAAKKVLDIAVKGKDALKKGNRASSPRCLSVLTELFSEDSYVSFRLGDVERSKASCSEALASASGLEKLMGSKDKDMRDYMALADAYTQHGILMLEGVIPVDEKAFDMLKEVILDAKKLPGSSHGTFAERLERGSRLALR